MLYSTKTNAHGKAMQTRNADGFFSLAAKHFVLFSLPKSGWKSDMFTNETNQINENMHANQQIEIDRSLRESEQACVLHHLNESTENASNLSVLIS